MKQHLRSIKKQARLRIIGKTIWHGVAGIFFEIILILFFIATAYSACILWWKIIK
ncbi:MAG: hypothetical protein WC779_08685 [Candidatus Omnitrophota bacterium]